MAANYYILMVDHGRYGLEANVHPEDTRRNIIARTVEAIGDGNDIAWIHHIVDGGVEDVTEDIMRAAIAEREKQMEDA